MEDGLRDSLEERLQPASERPDFFLQANSIAHDLANLLSVIKNYANTIRKIEGETASPSVPYAEKIVQTTSKAAELLQQLLGLGLVPDRCEQVIRPGEILRELQGVIAGLYPSTVRLEWKLASADWDVLVEPSQLERAVVNLAINAARAIPADGTVTLSCNTAKLTQPLAAVGALINPGEYVKLDVRDSGVGMSPEQILSAFEPYYSTRSDGRGLGLPMVLTFARKSGGGVTVQSQPGKGTCFSLYLRRHAHAVPC